MPDLNVHAMSQHVEEQLGAPSEDGMQEEVRVSRKGGCKNVPCENCVSRMCECEMQWAWG